MMNWIIAGALSAVLLAEIFDAVIVHRLARRCAGLSAAKSRDVRLVHWYAEGFEHSETITGWLRAGTLMLMILAFLCAAHPAVIIASAVLALIAHGEQRLSGTLRKRFKRIEA